MYKIDGTDLTQAIGFLPDADRTTANSFERPRDVAPVYSYKWPDGVVEYDLTTIPGEEPRAFQIKGLLYATSETDYKTKKSALRTLVKKPYNTIYASEVEETVNAKFEKFTQWERLTPIKGSTQIVTRVAMSFNEVLGLTFPTYGLYYGPSASIPTTAANVLALTAAPFANEVQISTGTTQRVISIAIQEGKTITSATDLTAGIFGAVNYLQRGTVVINSVTYRIYSLELGAPYSTNHTHKIVIA